MYCYCHTTMNIQSNETTIEQTCVSKIAHISIKVSANPRLPKHPLNEDEPFDELI